ncbi:MAG: hypothetical protein AABY22_35725, partial [Nanoarchaeota archaeon]
LEYPDALAVVDATWDMFDSINAENPYRDCLLPAYWFEKNEEPFFILFSRFLQKKNDDSSLLRSYGRRFITWLFNRNLKLLSPLKGFHFTDATLSFRIYPNWLFAGQNLDLLRLLLSDCSPFEVQLVLLHWVTMVMKKDLVSLSRIKEIPFIYHENKSTLTWKNIIDVLKLFKELRIWTTLYF